MLRGKFITLNAYFEKEERFQINDLSFHPEKREKEKQGKADGGGEVRTTSTSPG